MLQEPPSTVLLLPKFLWEFSAFCVTLKERETSEGATPLMPIPDCWFGIPGEFTLREFLEGVDMLELLEALE